ncbi:hypothetical protein PM10SUCC1_22970 [Propionigenium maris DSM 9537]|uniref:Glycosyl transferases group 1 n=1 Tax=Propionigenium maris DSM 9537 TaxID=1123000 RepID=A0A9W6GKG8_9FUSO|nr:hypothetical protein [Propionigenium maris]GLI56783.1 hypothetical protein PM10SUCC1_22970 [Propionigenium maris DSM 9537]
MKILFLATSNINAVGGDTVQLCANMNMYAQENEVHYFSRYKLYHSANIEGLCENIEMIFPTIEHEINEFSLSISKYIKYAERIDEEENFDWLYVRGSELIKEITKGSRLIEKTIVYITDYETLEEEEYIKIFKKARLIRCQSKQHMNMLIEKYGVKKDQVFVSPPILEPIPDIYKQSRSYDIAYIGKVHRDWKVDEYLEILKLGKYKGALAYSRFSKYSEDEIVKFEKELDYLKENCGLLAFKGISREESLELASRAKIGYAFRSEKIDNENSFEISSKLLEYCELGVVPVLRRTAIHEEIFGEEFIGYCEDLEECKEKIETILNLDDFTLKKIRSKLKENVKLFYVNAVYENIKRSLISI